MLTTIIKAQTRKGSTEYEIINDNGLTIYTNSNNGEMIADHVKIVDKNRHFYYQYVEQIAEHLEENNYKYELIEY